METANDTEDWLASLPIDQPVDVDGETVYLKTSFSGAELGIFMINGFVDQQRNDLLRISFDFALNHEAGLALFSDDENVLVLSRWLPEVSTWPEALEALDDIMNQAAQMRAALIPVEDDNSSNDGMQRRQEQRVRSLISGAA